MKPTPKNIGRKFARGYWVNMLAQEFEIDEAHVECQLMKYVLGLERDKYKRKPKPRR